MNYQPRQSPQLFLFDAGEMISDQLYSLAVALFEDHISAGVSSGRLKPRTVNEYRVSMRRFAEWVSVHPPMVEWFHMHRSATPMHMICQLSRRELGDWLDWVESTTTGVNAGRVANKRREHLSAILARLADRHETTTFPVPPKRRKQTSRRQKVTMTLDEVGRLYESARTLSAPPSWDNGLGSFGEYWRAAIVFFSVLGVDTGTLWPMDRDDPSALRWRSWYRESTPPTRNTDTRNAHGWLIYVRGKTAYPMQRPVNAQLAWQLHRLATLRPAAKPDDLIFPPWKRSHRWRPTEIFRRLCRTAEITPAIDGRTFQPVPWLLLHLRKTSATWHNTAVPGSGSAVLGHRSTELASVTESHYVDCNPLAERAILTTPLPKAFPKRK